MKFLHCFITLCFLLVGTLRIPAHSAEEELSVLLITINDGTKCYFDLAERPIVTLDEEGLNVNSTNKELSASFADVLAFTFVRQSDVPAGPPTSVDSVGGGHNLVIRYLDGNTVSVFGCTDKDKVSVYTLSGVSISANILRSANSAIVNLSALPSGVYIINVCNKSFKISK